MKSDKASGTLRGWISDFYYLLMKENPKIPVEQSSSQKNLWKGKNVAVDKYVNRAAESMLPKTG